MRSCSDPADAVERQWSVLQCKRAMRKRVCERESISKFSGFSFSMFEAWCLADARLECGFPHANSRVCSSHGALACLLQVLTTKLAPWLFINSSHHLLDTQALNVDRRFSMKSLNLSQKDQTAHIEVHPREGENSVCAYGGCAGDMRYTTTSSRLSKAVLVGRGISWVLRMIKGCSSPE